MNYIYPKFNKKTHIVKSAVRGISGISTVYPVSSDFSNRRDLTIQEGTQVCVVEEGIGYECQWSLVKEVGSNTTNASYYILSDNLQNVGGKKTLKTICTKENDLDPRAEEINPYLKEVFVPYIDKKNGLYSVRIQTDYDKVVDSFIFENLLNDVFYEGISLLLESRGFKSDNSYINTLLNKYYTFAYINDDLALTVNRACEPLTFTVSIPLRFFNEEITVSSPITNPVADRKITFSNFSIEQTLAFLLNILKSKEDDFKKLVYPNKVIENFILSVEEESIRAFLKSASELFALAGHPINPKNNFIVYELGLSDDFDLIYIKAAKDNVVAVFNQQLMAQFRLTSEFNSKRIFYYLYNIKQMQAEVSTLSANEFLEKYVNYEKPIIAEEKQRINGKLVSPEKIAQYRIDFEKASEGCLNYGDITEIVRNVRDLASYTDPNFHIFTSQTQKTEKDIKAADELKKEKSASYKPSTATSPEKAAEEKKASQSISDVATVSTAQFTKLKAERIKKFIDEYKANPENYKDKNVPKEFLDEVDLKEYYSEARNGESDILPTYSDLVSKLEERDVVIDLQNEVKTLTVEEKNDIIETADLNIKAIESDNEDYKSLNPSSVASISEQDRKFYNIGDTQITNAEYASFREKKLEQEKQKKQSATGDSSKLASGETVAAPVQVIETKEVKQETQLTIQEPSAFSKTAGIVWGEIKDTAKQFGVGAGEAIQQIKSTSNLNTLLYGLHRINFNRLLFNKLLCALKGANVSSPEIQQILSEIPEEITRYFNYLLANQRYEGKDFIDALQKGLIPDPKVFCVKNAGVIYYIKGLNKILKTINNVGSLVTSIQSTVKAPQKKESAWTVFGRQFILQLEQQLVTEAFNLVRDSLETYCDDTLLEDNNNNFKNPFDTNFPIAGFGESKNNSNQDVIRNNRKEILDEVFNELQFGFDREYVVDLTGRLTADINCILTPKESVDLLQGNPSDLSIVLIKNLIRNKYSIAPNDLSFLLNDIKLKQFFRAMGQTVDPAVLEEIKASAPVNFLSPSELCSPQQLIARQDLIKNKLPPDLDVLQKQQDIRNKNAKRIFDRIKNGSVDIPINSLCDDINNPEVIATKEEHLNNIKDTCKSIFGNVLTNFDAEAEQLNTAFTEEKTFYRLNSDGKLFDSPKYYLFNSNLGMNLDRASNTVYDHILFNNSLSLSKHEGYRVKYSYLSQEADLAQLSKITLPSVDEKSAKVICAPEGNEFDAGFLNFIRNGNVIIEFAQDFTFDGESLTDGTDLQELKNDTGIRNNSVAGRYLNSKKYFYTISLNADGLAAQIATGVAIAAAGVAAGGALAVGGAIATAAAGAVGTLGTVATAGAFTAGGVAIGAAGVAAGITVPLLADEIAKSDADEISFKLIFNDTNNNSFRILENITFEEDPREQAAENDVLAVGSDYVYNDINRVTDLIRNNYGLEEVFNLDTELTNNIIETSKNKLVGLRLNENFTGTGATDDIYVLNELIFNNLDIKTKRAIEGVYLQNIKPKIENIERFLLTTQQIENFQQTGLFQSETLLPVEKNGKAIKKINVGYGKYNPDLNDTQYGLQNFISYEYKTDITSNLSQDNGNIRPEVKQAVTYVYEYLLTHPTNKTTDVNVKNTLALNEDGSPAKIISRKRLTDDYVSEAIDYLDNYVTVNGIEQVSRIVNELKEYIVAETKRPAIEEFDRLYSEIEDGDSFLRDLASVGVQNYSQEEADRLSAIISQTLITYGNALSDINITRDEVQKYVDTAVDDLDGNVTSTNIDSLYFIVNALSRRICEGQSALKTFDELYSIDESGDSFLDDLRNSTAGVTDASEEAVNRKKKIIEEIFSQLQVSNFVSDKQDLNKYLKLDWNVTDFIFSLKEGETTPFFGQDADSVKIIDEQYDMKFKDLASYEQFILLSKICKLKYPKDQRYLRCNVHPHYFNLDYLIELAASIQKNKLCNLEGFSPYDIIKILLVELTFRTYVTDLLVKSVPYLATLTEDELLNLYKQKHYVDIIRLFMKRDLKTFSPSTTEDVSVIDSYYAKYLFEITKDVFVSYSANNKINNQYTGFETENPAVDYFIRKEINRFIKYSLKFGLFTPNGLENFSDFINSKVKDETAKAIAKLEFDTAISYYMMANTIDATKRLIFYSTKSDLAQIFFSNISSLIDVGSDANFFKQETRSQQDIIDFMLKLSYSSSPASMALIKPNYASYVKKFLVFTGEAIRDTLMKVAQTSDPNIILTKQINALTSLVALTSWSFVDQQTRIDLILKDPTLTFKRIDDGKAPVADIGTSLAVWLGTAIPPQFIGWAYLAIDTYNEGQYMEKAKAEIASLRGQAITEDPCEVPKEKDKETVLSFDTCTDDSRTSLRSGLNSIE